MLPWLFQVKHTFSNIRYHEFECLHLERTNSIFECYFQQILFQLKVLFVDIVISSKIWEKVKTISIFYTVSFFTFFI